MGFSISEHMVLAALAQCEKSLDEVDGQPDRDYAAGVRSTVKSIVGALILETINQCDCGGRGPDDPEACAACLLFHKIRPINDKIPREGWLT